MSPLHKGKGQKVISKNIHEMMSSYEDTGKIGNTKPKNAAHARKIAAAAAYEKARSGHTNPIDQGSSNSPIGSCPGGSRPAGMPFLKK